MRMKILTILISSLLLAACGEDLSFYEQAYAPLAIELSFDGCASSEQYNDVSTGKIRYIIRTFPVGASYAKAEPVQEFTIVKDAKDGFDHTATLDFLVGSYDVLVWADLIPEGKEESCYNVDDFGRIALDLSSTGNNDCRKAFRGMATVDVGETDKSYVATIAMKSPLARFELVSNDLQEFLAARRTAEGNSLSLDDFRIVVFYTGYMPSVYSLYTDKPVDSATDVSFESSFREISDEEVALGFDYVLVGENASAVNVKVGVYDADGKLVSASAAVRVPLQRGENTVKTGSFLTSKSSLDGIYIDKDYDGNFDIEL